jgi:hypothetical protein
LAPLLPSGISGKMVILEETFFHFISELTIDVNIIWEEVEESFSEDILLIFKRL